MTILETTKMLGAQDRIQLVLLNNKPEKWKKSEEQSRELMIIEVKSYKSHLLLEMRVLKVIEDAEQLASKECWEQKKYSSCGLSLPTGFSISSSQL